MVTSLLCQLTCPMMAMIGSRMNPGRFWVMLWIALVIVCKRTDKVGGPSEEVTATGGMMTRREREM